MHPVETKLKHERAPQ